MKIIAAAHEKRASLRLLIRAVLSADLSQRVAGSQTRPKRRDANSRPSTFGNTRHHRDEKEETVAYTLEQLCDDIKQTLSDDPGPAGKRKVCQFVSKALLDGDFVGRHLTPELCQPRKVLYEDPELGFCVCGHVYDSPRTGAPHDHGPAWAIYGLATGMTEMTDWEIVKAGAGDEPSLVKPVKVYALDPGDCHFYDVGAVHSPRWDGGTRLIRVEGKNLDHIKRSNIKAA
jgi:hypothetical protein